MATVGGSYGKYHSEQSVVRALNSREAFIRSHTSWTGTPRMDALVQEFLSSVGSKRATPRCSRGNGVDLSALLQSPEGKSGNGGMYVMYQTKRHKPSITRQMKLFSAMNGCSHQHMEDADLFKPHGQRNQHSSSEGFHTTISIVGSSMQKGTRGKHRRAQDADTYQQGRASPTLRRTTFGPKNIPDRESIQFCRKAVNPQDPSHSCGIYPTARRFFGTSRHPVFPVTRSSSSTKSKDVENKPQKMIAHEVPEHLGLPVGSRAVRKCVESCCTPDGRAHVVETQIIGDDLRATDDRKRIDRVMRAQKTGKHACRESHPVNRASKQSQLTFEDLEASVSGRGFSPPACRSPVFRTAGCRYYNRVDGRRPDQDWGCIRVFR